MAVRIVVAQSQKENQILKMDANSRYIINEEEQWQFLFGPNSSLTNSSPIIKIAARFDDDTFTKIKLVSYLYDSRATSIVNAASCTFKIFKVNLPDWTETLVTTINGTQLTNNYFYINPDTSTLTPLDFFGGDTMMVESTIVRLGVTYRDRLYINHLGIYDNVDRLRKDVEFLDITKLDE